MPARESAVQTPDAVAQAAPQRSNISHGKAATKVDLNEWSGSGWTGSPYQGTFQESSRPSSAKKQGYKRSASKESKDDERLKEAARQLQALGPEAVVAVPWYIVEGTYKVGDSVGLVPAFKRMLGGITGLGAGTSR